jgi:tRNA(Leu) C34 or U34 (ribose-2'-O)-methylase TrmL
MTAWPNAYGPGEQSKLVVYVTTQQGCMNLAASVNVILYDRLAKRHRHP